MTGESASVVAWQWKLVTEGDHLWTPCSVRQAAKVANDPEWMTRALVPESELAEALNCLGEMQDLCRQLIDEKQTLISGLEALAVEWRKRATGCGDSGNYKMEMAYDLAAKELEQFLASAGLEGK